jgi:hypothetical protein
MTRRPPKQHWALILVASVAAAPLAAQAPQFRADVRQTGDTPFTGTIYVGASRVRIEGTSNGEQMTMIVDSDAATVTMLMPDQRAYMTMDAGSMPFSAPGSTSMDPADPCSSGEVTDCRSLGTQTVNGHSARADGSIRATVIARRRGSRPSCAFPCASSTPTATRPTSPT